MVEEEGTASTVSATIGGLSLVAKTVDGGAIIASADMLGGASTVVTAAATVVGDTGADTGAFIS